MSETKEPKLLQIVTWQHKWAVAVVQFIGGAIVMGLWIWLMVSIPVGVLNILLQVGIGFLSLMGAAVLLLVWCAWWEPTKRTISETKMKEYEDVERL